MKPRISRSILHFAAALALVFFGCSPVAKTPPAQNPAEPVSPQGLETPAGSEYEGRATKARTEAEGIHGTPRTSSTTDVPAAESRVRGSSSDDAQAARVKAGTHDDNEEYPSWVTFSSRKWLLPMVLPAAYHGRTVLRVTDSAGAPVMAQSYTVEGTDHAPLWRGLTYANGETVLFPSVFLSDQATPASVVCHLSNGQEIRVPWRPSLDGFITVQLDAPRRSPRRIPVDVAFVLDATGSMGDEIQQLRDVLFSIHSRLLNAARNADIRFGLVVYRDRGDAEPLRVVPFTANVDSFQLALESVNASGGGDTPEDVHIGLRAALKDLAWRDGSIRNAFLIADAPPHTDYGQDYDYLWASRTANSMGIRINTVGASGLDQSGEHAFRQISVATYGQFIFLTYGETGESSGTGSITDPGRVSHHTGANWSARRLDDIVVDLVRRDIAYQTEVPKLVTDNPPPVDQHDHLAVRMENLWQQVQRQLAAFSSDTLTAVLLPFESTLDDSSHLEAYLRDISTETLLRLGFVRMVERDRLAQIIAEQSLSVVAAIEPSRAIELGHLLNSRVVFFGKIYRLGTDRVVHVRAVETETGQIVAAARVRV